MEMLTPLQQEVLRDADDLPRLLPGWGELAARAGTCPMQDAAWSAACATTVDGGNPLAVVVVGGLDRPRAVAPLVRRGAHYELLGADALREPAELLAEDPAALRELAAGIAALRTPVLLHRLPLGSPSIAAVMQAFRPFGVVVTRESRPHATIALDEGWMQPEGRLSSGRASDLRRARRRAAAEGDLAVELLAPGLDDVDALLDDAFAIEARSWKGRAGTALAVDRDRAAFFRRYGRNAARRGELRVAFLRLGDQRVAMQLAVEWGRRLWLLKIGHDEAVQRCSPGMLLLLEVVRDAAARGIEAVQLLGGIEPWTRMWTDVVEPCVTAAAYPPGVTSLFAVVGDAAVAAQSRRGRRRA